MPKVVERRRARRVARTPESTIKGRAYEHIRRGILDASLPVGAALSEYQLAAEIGVSRTPVREALKRLEQEGLVRAIARRGTFIADLTVRDIIEIYQVRGQLEAFAARVAAERMDPALAKTLLAEMQRAKRPAAAGRLDAAREHDLHLHKAVIASTSNGRLTRILGTLDDQVHKIRHQAFSHPSRVEASFVEHGAILKAIIDRDPARAEHAMRDHLEAARDNAIQLVLAGTQF